jgi:hypothetical protein
MNHRVLARQCGCTIGCVGSIFLLIEQKKTASPCSLDVIYGMFRLGEIELSCMSVPLIYLT